MRDRPFLRLTPQDRLKSPVIADIADIGRPKQVTGISGRYFEEGRPFIIPSLVDGH
jgi:hypothetical protein